MPSSQFLVTAGYPSDPVVWGTDGYGWQHDDWRAGGIQQLPAPALRPAQQLTWLVNAAGEAAAGVQRAFTVLDTPLEIESFPINPSYRRSPDRLNSAR